MKNNPKVYGEREMDTVLFIITFLLVLIGVIMILSASAYSAARAGNEFHNFIMQILGACIGFVAILVARNLKFEIITSWLTWAFYLFSIVLLIATIFLGHSVQGATRWLQIGPVQIQPSEISKIAIILALSVYLANDRGKGPSKIDTLPGAIVCIFIVALPVILVIIPGGMSTAIILAAIGFVICFVSSAYIKRFVLLGVFGIIGIVSLLFFGGGFREGRVFAWLNPYADAAGMGFQTIQSLYAIASGGLFGLGLGNSNQKLNFLPEAHNDFIFAIIVEEMGILGGIIILILFAILIWRATLIAIKCTKPSGSLIATGVLTMISVQVLINVGVVTNTIPNTGIPLPFISYGGTSIVVMMAAIGLLLNVSRYQKIEDSMIIYAKQGNENKKDHNLTKDNGRIIKNRDLQNKIYKRRA